MNDILISGEVEEKLKIEVPACAVDFNVISGFCKLKTLEFLDSLCRKGINKKLLLDFCPLIYQVVQRIEKFSIIVRKMVGLYMWIILYMQKLIFLIVKLHKQLKTTFIYVTHDQIEAMTMGTRIVVMKLGVVQQIDTPTNLFDYPENKFVAGFIGTPQMNFFEVKIKKVKETLAVTFENGETQKYSCADKISLKRKCRRNSLFGQTTSG